MGKVNVQCLRLDMEADDPAFPTQKHFDNEMHHFKPAEAGLTISVGLAPANPDETSMSWPVLGGLMVRVQIETRKPAPKLVKAAARKKLKTKYPDGNWTPEQQLDAEETAHAELWSKMDGEYKFVWVFISKDIVLVFAKGSAVEKVTFFLRRVLGTFPVRNFWEGHLFSAAVVHYIGGGELAGSLGVEFTNDLTLKSGRKSVRLVDADDLQAEEVVHFTEQAMTAAAAGMLVDGQHWALVTPHGGMSLDPVTAREEDIEDAESMWQFDCATQMITARHVSDLAHRLRALTVRYDDDKKVELPLP